MNVVKEPSVLVNVQYHIENGISTIARVVELSDQLAEMKDECCSRTQQLEEKVTCLKEKTLQYKICKRRQLTL